MAFSDALDIDKSGFGIALASALVSLAKTLQGSNGRKTPRDLQEFSMEENNTHTNHVENMGQHEIHGEIFGKHTVYVGVDFILLHLCWVGSVSQ